MLIIWQHTFFPTTLGAYKIWKINILKSNLRLMTLIWNLFLLFTLFHWNIQCYRSALFIVGVWICSNVCSNKCLKLAFILYSSILNANYVYKFTKTFHLISKQNSLTWRLSATFFNCPFLPNMLLPQILIHLHSSLNYCLAILTSCYLGIVS